MTPYPACTIRQACAADTEEIYRFILKMGEYEHLSAEIDTSVEALRQALFTEHQAEVVLSEVEGVAVGFALYFYNFSTFRGQRGLYLEDLFVNPEMRGRGYGKALFLHLVHHAVTRKCRRMEWVALHWNHSAIAFYQALGATPMQEWQLFRLSEAQLHHLDRIHQSEEHHAI